MEIPATLRSRPPSVRPLLPRARPRTMGALNKLTHMASLPSRRRQTNPPLVSRKKRDPFVSIVPTVFHFFSPNVANYHRSVSEDPQSFT